MDAYLFLAEFWEPGDRIYVFGAGCGAYCARALTRLLNIVGVLAPGCDELLQYVLENWALPHTHRTPQDWESLARLATRLFGLPDADIAVGVEYLGLWDTTKVPGLSRESAQHLDTDPLANVAAGRHAVAIDERRLPAREHLMSPAAAVEEVWFRGTHADVTGGSGGPATTGRYRAGLGPRGGGTGGAAARRSDRCGGVGAHRGRCAHR